MNFIIFYDDGREISATENTVDKLDSFGVICIVQSLGDGRNHILSKKDYYILVGNFWLVVDMMGLIDHLANKPNSIKKLLVGRTIDNVAFWKIFDIAKTYV